MSKLLYRFACFDCRVAFKRDADDSLDTPSAHLPESSKSHGCPKCSNRMAFMGRNFSAPKRRDKSGWYAARRMWEHGFRFVGSGYHEGLPLPRDKPSVESCLADNPSHPLKVAEPLDWDAYRKIAG